MTKRFLSLVAISLLLMAIAAKSFAEQPAQRIVALAPHIVEMLFDIGAGDKIVGAVAYSDYPKAALDIPRVGSYHGMQIEKLLALNPDLVIVWKSGNSQSDIDKMKRLGLKIVFSNPVDIADVATELRYFGGLTGHQQQAERVALAYEQRLKKLRLDNKTKQAIPVFYQLWSEPMMTINGTTWINQLIEVCQGVNVFKDNPTPYPKISTENVIVAQPHLMILPDENSDKPQPIIDWQKWPEIPAVKNNKFIHVDADLLHRFSTRMLSGIADMCEKIDQQR
ncbi:cobalamin-binding protein [Colwellia hornerae]|uniref:Cobalamin-binding protein n=1 Tax=Colwellia hornerae TaxID=89402 RepID=A0A5C6Q665_9GAMM|nr:cobalamin-binding protein [Colwellia hornerae]TWX59499.1 cobalamin-binding protein [Colwellia hornerae]TWX62869.1 cobalamin-binding protein [Colwellia hornerae]TWX64191.1 cobalamin-binding protein [Colwellia hornerae]